MNASYAGPAAFWEPRLPGKIAKRIALAEPLPGHTIELEGNDLVAVQVGHTDMDAQTTTTACEVYDQVLELHPHRLKASG